MYNRVSELTLNNTFLRLDFVTSATMFVTITVLASSLLLLT